MKRKTIAVVILALALSSLACGAGGAVTRRNSQVRRAALAYELAERGPVDEVLVAFGLTEVRADLGFEGGNTVWLNSLARAEYFRSRDTGKSYLYLHELSFDDGTASIVAERGDAMGFRSRRLGLSWEESGWEVVADEVLE
jgi:hypothetical protein